MRSFLDYDGHLCGSCSYCCWALKAPVPRFVSIREAAGEEVKPANTPCRWMRPGGGCAQHDRLPEGSACRGYACPWVLTTMPETRRLVRLAGGVTYPWTAHRPDVFQEVLGEPWVEAKGVMPLVPDCIPAEKAVALVRRTGAIPAARSRRDANGHVVDGFDVALERLTAAADLAAAEEAWEQALRDGGLPRAA